MNSFENNIKVEEAFNNLLDNKVWIKHNGIKTLILK